MNPKSVPVKHFKEMFEFLVHEEDAKESELSDINDIAFSDIIYRLAYFKPMRGEMERSLSNEISKNYLKNFFDECEWRYVPDDQILEKIKMSPVIFNKDTQSAANLTNNIINHDREYKDLCLKFKLNEIRYLIVPNLSSRKDLIKFIMNLKIDTEYKDQEKYILISKIIVLDDVKKDF